jgi:hypothetical protein
MVNIFKLYRKEKALSKQLFLQARKIDSTVIFSYHSFVKDKQISGDKRSGLDM